MTAHAHRLATAHADLCVPGRRCRCWCAECYRPDAVYGGRCVCESCVGNEERVMPGQERFLPKSSAQAPWLLHGWHPTSRGQQPTGVVWPEEGVCSYCGKLEPLAIRTAGQPPALAVHRRTVANDLVACTGSGTFPHSAPGDPMGEYPDPYEYGAPRPAVVETGLFANMTAHGGG